MCGLENGVVLKLSCGEEEERAVTGFWLGLAWSGDGQGLGQTGKSREGGRRERKEEQGWSACAEVAQHCLARQ